MIIFYNDPYTGVNSRKDLPPEALLLRHRREKKQEGNNTMKLQPLPYDLTVCKLAAAEQFDLNRDFYFLEKTDEEISLVCRSEDTPANTISREEGWKAFRISGTLDFSLTGVLAELSAILAEQKIGIFAVSTYNTDYILVKKEQFDKALTVLASESYIIL